MKFSPAALYAWYRRTIRHPKWRWWLVAGTLVYLVMPVDLLPDILLPGIGFIDDMALVGLMVAELSQIGMDYLKQRQDDKNKVKPEEPATTVDVDVQA